MSVDRWQQILDLFSEAVECPSSERRLFLDRVCQGDPELRRELESLLAYDTPGQRLAEVPASFSSTCSDPESNEEMAGRRIGPYRVIRLIGHGGMGAVYLGVRDDDHYQKQVAIKLVKRGMDTDLMLSRFRQERQIVARLEHPFIARLLDGGATEDGLPWFAMEYVEGVPITTYCDENNVAIPERLRLFRLVCEAVQYAHSNLVVHRDIKPSNILTTEEGIPKLLDFGIAKLLDRGFSGEQAVTQGEFRLLTPDYASPEQVKGLPIGTAADTYSLGAVLYELLAGSRPHRFTTGSAADIEKTICEKEPEKPSSAVARNKDLPQAKRKHLIRRLSGDLDNIVLTAMRIDPERRYGSVADFSEDLRRHLEALPVLAREAKWSYRAGRFIRRNRLAVGAGLLVAASLLGGIATTSMQARRAEHRFELARQLAKAMVADIKGPMGQLPGSTALRASMIRTVLQYLDGLSRDAGADPAFLLDIADTYREVASVEGHPFQPNLGQIAAALDHYQNAIGIYERLADRPETKSHALSALITTNIQAGDVEARHGNPQAARRRLENMAALASQNAAADSTVVGPGTWLYLYFRLGTLEMRAGAPDRALVHFKKALEVCEEWDRVQRTVDTRGTLHSAYIRLAEAHKETGHLHEARHDHETALRMAEDSASQSSATVLDRSMRAVAHQGLANLMGNPEELNFGDRRSAISHIRTAIAILETMAAADSANVRVRDDLASAWRSLGAILMEQRAAEALKIFQRAASLSEELSAAVPANTKYRRDIATTQMRIGESLVRLRRTDEALTRLNYAIDKARSLASDDPGQLSLIAEIGRIHRGIGGALLSSGNQRGAIENYTRALAVADDLIRRAPSSLYFERERAEALEALGRYYQTLGHRKPELRSEARRRFQQSLAIWQDWKRRKLAEPYAGVREARTTALIAALGRT